MISLVKMAAKKRNSESPMDQPINLIRSELDLFNTEGHDMSILSTQTIDYFPTTPLTDSLAPITFNIQGTSEHYVDLSQTRLYMRLKVTKEDGSDIADTDITVPVNNILHSAFSQCSIFLNEQQITTPNMYYAYRAYFERLLCTSKEFNKTQSVLAGYHKEHNPYNTDETVEDSLKKRHEMSKKSAVFEVLGRPHADIFHCGTYLPPAVNIRVALTRSSDAFALYAKTGTDWRLNILEAKLQVTKYKVQPAVAMSHISMWESGHVANLYLNRVDIKSYGLPIGTLNSVNESLVVGELPSRLVIALVSTQKMIGAMNENPFIFGGHHLSNICVSINSDVHDSRDLEVSFETRTKRIKEAVHNLYRSIGIAELDSAIDLTDKDFENGYALFAYDIATAGDAIPLSRHGNIKIDLKFNRATNQALTVLVYTETPSVLHIDKNKNVFFSNSAPIV